MNDPLTSAVAGKLTQRELEVIGRLGAATRTEAVATALRTGLIA